MEYKDPITQKINENRMAADNPSAEKPPKKIYNVRNKWEIYAPPTIEEIYDIGMQIKELKYRQIFFFLYLTGARITEALHASDTEMQREKMARTRKWLLNFTINTLKNKKQRVRTIAIPGWMPVEIKMMNEFLPLYTNRLKDSPTKLFKDVTSRQAVEKAFRNIKMNLKCIEKLPPHTVAMREFHLTPHMLRHFRLTHLVTLFHANDRYLTRFAGWTNSNPAGIYVSMSATEMGELFRDYK